MRSEQQHIDDFFRKKDEEYQPDTGPADSHWEQMRGLLKPGPDPVPKGLRLHTTRRIIKYIGGFAVVTVITLVTLTVVRSKKKAATAKALAQQTMAAPKKQQPAAQQPIAHKTAPVQPAKKAIPQATTNTASRKPTATKAAITANTGRPKGTVITKASDSPAIQQPLLRLNGQQPKVENQPVAIATSQPRPINEATLNPVTTAAIAAGQINDFYSQFDKPANVFLVDVAEGSVLNGKEGTRLTIPAFAFAGRKGLIKEGLVTIVLKEYYSYEDILSAKLSTTSGNEPLVSDGMVHIAAHLNGMPVDVAAGKNIKLEMPTRKFDEQMQLFRGVRSSMKNAFVAKFMDNRMIDTVRFMKREADENGDIDWIPQGQEQKRSDPLNRKIRVMNPYADPYRVAHGKKRIAWYYVAKTCPLTNEEMRIKLRQHTNNYFDEIKIKRVNVAAVANYRYQQDKMMSVAGDSVEMTFNQALYKQLLSPEDSSRIMEKILQENADAGQREQLMGRYNFTITGLGWYNCDRFNNRGPKTLFAFRPGEGFEPTTMVSHLVFTNYRSVLKGTYKDNKITFGKVPKDQPVRIVCIGIKDGKVMSCIQELNTDREEIGNLAFTETTPEQFRKKLQGLELVLP